MAITFVIDNENGITAYLTQKEAKEAAGEGSHLFSSQEQLDKLVRSAPVGSAALLVEIWNTIPGVQPVKKFTSTAIGVTRIWNAVQKLAPEAPEAAEVAPPAANAAPSKTSREARLAAEKKRTRKPAKAKTGDSAEPRDTKKLQVVALCQQPGGAMLDAIMKATGWQRHTVRGFMATVPKKMGLRVISEKVEGQRTYRLAPRGAAKKAAE